MIPGDNLEKLMANLLGHLDNECTNAMGEIVENDSGKVIHQCRKSSTE